MLKSQIRLLLCLLWFTPAVLCAETGAFEADEKLQENTRKWAEEFIRFAAEEYEVDLDWSHVSIKYLDEIVDDLHRIYRKESPPEHQIVPISRALGSYVAEVHRFYYGGRWGWITLEEGSFPGIQATSGATFLPLAKALDRIKTGNDPDIWEYYQLLSERQR